ncbi:hypothetical protein [Enterococcus cecorum]|uniref:hypothetical protein n=1 Tax=Enterococcus cecorum TaxID=44008 RepID=UPI00148B6F33|nr:hypothetical protein [Enterococcus cecorum]
MKAIDEKYLYEVVFVCGLIGSGKTTYVMKNQAIFTDLDLMNDLARKIDQINYTKSLLKKYKKVYHITTYPTEEELEAFKKYKNTFLWIDTDVEQCKTNILIRNRKRDIENLNKVYEANKNLMQKFKESRLPFQTIKVM